MAQGKQVKIVTPKQEVAVLKYLEGTRYPERNRAMLLLSTKAGFRAKEIACLTWDRVTDADGNVANEIESRNQASKGKGGGRTIPLNRSLREALVALHRSRGGRVAPDHPVIHSERGKGMSAGSVTVWFHQVYSGLGLSGCSSHSGRRTFITKAARRVIEAGGSLRDVQQLAGHANLATTLRYIEDYSDAKRRLVDMI